jgi:hypothetical protein
VVLADFGVSHRLKAAVEGAGESSISAAGRAGSLLTGGVCMCGDCFVVLHCIRAVCVGWCALPSRAGGRALGPFEWQAPEVCQLVTSGNEQATMATTPSDVYMLGQCCDFAFDLATLYYTSSRSVKKLCPPLFTQVA